MKNLCRAIIRKQPSTKEAGAYRATCSRGAHTFKEKNFLCKIELVYNIVSEAFKKQTTTKNQH